MKACRTFLFSSHGFTLVEVLVAMAILAIALAGIGVTVASQARGGVAGGTNFGLAAIIRGNYISTATMLAQARLEEIKNATYTASTDQITSTNFPDQDYGGITNYTGFKRTVSIQSNTPASAMKTVTVTVYFKPPKESGLQQEENLALVTIIARRP